MRKILLFFSQIVLLTGCFDRSDQPVIKVQNEINEFIWGGLNSWYFYQDEVIDLTDQKFESLSDKNAFLNAFASPSQLFQTLRHPEDRFSWIVDDYIELNNSFQGISKSFGYEFGLVNFQGQVLGYIQYILPDSPAAEAGLKRGEIISTVNGTQITSENYVSLFFSEEQYTLGFADIVDNEVVETGKTVNLLAITLTEDPVLYSEVFEFQGLRIGYLVYNRFTHTFHKELNEAFAEFSQSNIDELVVDLRYNPGGAVTTAALLSSMIYGQAIPSEVFTDLIYNFKHARFNQNFNFLDIVPVLNGNFQVVEQENMNRVSLDRVYILTGSGTASASELVINGLEPYLDVIQVGSTTRGKNEGSITLYDAPESDYMSRDMANPNHRWAMQPIVFRLVNANGFGDYADGLVSDVEVNEVEYLADIRPFGDPDEHLLRAALDHMTGVGLSGRRNRLHVTTITSSLIWRKHGDEMYISPIEIN